jgi:hypothetical protein
MGDAAPQKVFLDAVGLPRVWSSAAFLAARHPRLRSLTWHAWCAQNSLYVDSFKMARAIWDDGFRPTVRPGCRMPRPPTGVHPCVYSFLKGVSGAGCCRTVSGRAVARRHAHWYLRRGVLPDTGDSWACVCCLCPCWLWCDMPL